jgi:hypothetical protein
MPADADTLLATPFRTSMTATGTRSRILAVLLLVVSAIVGCTPALAEEPARATLRPSLPPASQPAATAPATQRPTPAASRRPERSAKPKPSAATDRPFAMSLYEEGDFVPQHTFEWCVGASVQMTWNLLRDDRRSSYRDQLRLWEMARDRSVNAFGGANPFGWAQVLTEIGLGPYEVVSIPNYRRALRAAASALRETGRPVGLVMWRGRHAWVMSGFESLGDPARGNDFTVTGIRVLDPLFPHGSSLWGPSPSPNSLLTPGELATDFVIRDRRNWSMNVTPGYLLVLPI